MSATPFPDVMREKRLDKAPGQGGKRDHPSRGTPYPEVAKLLAELLGKVYPAVQVVLR